MIADTPDTSEITSADALESAFSWWREAGVDSDYADDPSVWLAEPEAEQAVAAPRPAPVVREPEQTPLERAFVAVSTDEPIGGDRASWPKDLAAFREWWMSEKSLSPVGPDGRLPPRGVAGAKLWMVIPHPIEGDKDALLAGPEGRLVESILRAIGIAPHDAYLASALPAQTALPEWIDLAERGLGDVLRHHIALSSPARVIAFGRALAPLFGVSAERAREAATVQAGEAVLPLMIAPDLAELARSPERRRNFWNRWLEWTA